MTGKEEEIKSNLGEAEKNFGFENDTAVKQNLDVVIVYVERLAKLLSKIRQLKLTFTIEDERLINLVDQVSDDEIVNLGKLKTYYEANKTQLAEMMDNFDFLDGQPFEDADHTLNFQVRDNAKRYMEFFKVNNDDSVLDLFFLNCYLFRNEKYNDVLNHTAEFLNLILKKINIYKTTIFIRYYHDHIERILRANTEELKGKIEAIIRHKTPVSEFERLMDLTLKTSILINYIKSMIVSKKHNQVIFSYPYLREQLPAVLRQLKDFEEQYKIVHRELGHLDNFVNFLPDFQQASEEMRSFVGNIENDKEYKVEGLVHLATGLQNYNMQKSKFENIIIKPEQYDSRCLNLMNEYLKENNAVYATLKKQLFHMKIEK